MCGVLAVRSKLPIPRQAIESGVEAISHRGPDQVGIWQSDCRRVSIGHCRLHVRGKISATQPIVSRCKNLIVSVNGEFYDYQPLRKSLEARGCIFASDSDSELALHLYSEFGLELFTYLRGEFAIIIHDKRQNRTIAIRDRFGIKPLVYCNDTDQTVFASEAKAIFASGLLNAEWDVTSLQHTLAHQYLPPESSLFKNIQTLPPAHYAIVTSEGSLQIDKYWHPKFAEESIDPHAVLDLLTESVRKRINSRIQPAFTLSSGIDSSSIVAIASQIMGRKVKAFSVSFCDGDEFDEIEQVRKLSSEIGAELSVVPVSRQSMIVDLDDAVYFSEGLAINGQLVGKFLLAKAVRSAGHNVVISGEGADEAFLGYAHLAADCGFRNQENNRQTGIMLPDLRSNFIPPTKPEWLDDWPTFLQAKLQMVNGFQPLLTEPLDTDLTICAFLQQLHRTTSGDLPANLSSAKTSMWLWAKTALANYILKTLGDGTEMAHSVEGRVPFLDHKLFELAARASTASCINSTQTKCILRQALKPILPKSLINRPKHPFIAPPILQSPCPKPITDQICDSFRSQEFGALPLVNQKKTIQWFDDLLKSTDEDRKRKASPIIFTLLTAYHLQNRFNL